MASVRPIPIVMGMLGMKTGSQKSLKIQVDSRNRKRKKERFRDQILLLTKSGELVSFKNKKKKERTEKNEYNKNEENKELNSISTNNTCMMKLFTHKTQEKYNPIFQNRLKVIL